MANELLPVKDADRDQIRLLARREVVALLRGERRTWAHTVREEFATYHPLTNLMRWLGGGPSVRIGRHAAVNLELGDNRLAEMAMTPDVTVHRRVSPTVRYPG